MPLPLSSGFNGKLGRVLDTMLAELRAVRPASGPNVLTAQNSLGTTRTALPQGGNNSSVSFDTGTVQACYPNHLSVILDSDGSTVLVNKPPNLCVGSYDAFDNAVLNTFLSGGGFPGYGSVIWNGWFTTDYLMRTTGYADDVSLLDLGDLIDGSWAGWSGGSQSRNRLVYAPFRDTNSPFSPKRGSMLEYTWPPYFTADNQGGMNTGDRSLLIYKINTDYYDANQAGRIWLSQAMIDGEVSVEVMDLSNNTLSGMVTDSSGQRV